MITRNKTITISSDLVVGHTYEVVVVARDAQGNSQDIATSPRAVVTVRGKLATPAAPSALVATVSMYDIFLEWTNPSDPDLDVIEVWRDDTDTPPNPAMSSTNKLAEVKGNHYADNLGVAGVTKYYWVRARNKSGAYSDFNAVEGVGATSGAVTATSIADFAVTATKMFTNTVVLSGDSWTNNSPSSGYIAWNAHTLVYGGAAYSISAGNTNLAYLKWTIGATSYAGSATHPTSGFTIAMNNSGIHALVWNNSANMVIGSAYIGNLAADKITSGTLDCSLITVANLVVGDISASSITSGTLDCSVITVSNLSADSITAGTLTGRVVQTAASGQRVIIDAWDNSIKLNRTGETDPTILLDDNIQGNVPGIFVKSEDGGIIKLGTTDEDTIEIWDRGITISYSQVKEFEVDMGVVTASVGFNVGSNPVIGTQGAAVADATGAGDVVAQLNTLLARLRTHGLIAT